MPACSAASTAAQGTLERMAVRVDEAGQREGLGHGRILSRLMATRAVSAPLQQLPNALTIGRLVLIPIFVALMLSADGGHSWPAGIVFGAAGITDQIDGFLARRLEGGRAGGLRARRQPDRQGGDVAAVRRDRVPDRHPPLDRLAVLDLLDGACPGGSRRPGVRLRRLERSQAMKGVVMAGGEGTRLRPLTSNQPKPMVPIVGKPCMEHILELIREHGFEDVIVTVAFLPQAIRSYFGSGESLGLTIEYSGEESPLGTAGSVRLASDRLDETFLVISGDALCDVDLSEIVRTHEEKGAAVTIGLKSVENPLEFGIVVTDEDGRIERFLEKPSWGQVFSDTINTGIYVLEPEVLRHVPIDRPHDFSKELFPLLLEMGRPLYGYVCDGYWQDIGNLDQYRQAKTVPPPDSAPPKTNGPPRPGDHR